MILVKRSMLQIVHEMLQCNGNRKTHIKYQTALTHSQTEAYLGLLVERGLMHRGVDPSGRATYAVTPTGTELLKHLNVVMNYLGLAVDGK